MRRRAVLFDFDGTIMDTEPAIIASYTHLFELWRTPAEFTPELQIEVLGPSLAQEMAKFFPEHDLEECLREYRGYQNGHLAELVRPMEGAPELMRWLREEGYPTGIISTRLHGSLDHILAMQGMKEMFDIIIGHDDVQKEKPDPEGILHACKALGCAASVYIGDSATDIEAGLNAGSYTVAALTKPEKEASLRAAGPDACIRRLSELRELLRD